jgi:membrane protease YdiL (CAAX protease family)
MVERILFMHKIRSWIKNHPIVAFFGITFIISWGLGFTYDAVFNRDQYLWMPLASVATCAPGLVGILITSISGGEPRSGSKRITWLAFLVAWGAATVVFLGNNIIVNKAPFNPIVVVLFSIIVLPVAYILSAPFSRNPAVRRYLASMVRFHRVWGWLLLMLIVLVGILVLSALLSAALGRQSLESFRPSYQGWTLLKMMAITFLYQALFFNLTGEEVGWRGFALPRLQAHVSPLIASLVLTVFWALWHAFYFSALGDPVFTWGYWWDTFLRLFPATVIINWFYTRSKGSILVAGLTHATANTLFAYVPNLDWSVHTATSYAVVLGMIVIDRMWRKLPPDHPAVIQTPGRGPVA